MYESLLGFGLTGGVGVGLGLGEGEGFGIGERTTAVLTSFWGCGEGEGSSAVDFPLKKLQAKIPAQATISRIKVILIGRYFKIYILGQQW